MKATTKQARIEALANLHIMDSEHDPEFDDFIKLIVQTTSVPLTIISFADEDRVWSKARFGTTITEIPRAGAPCNRTLETGEILHIENLLQNEELADHPLVGLGYRFYACFPLQTKNGTVVGSVCMYDVVPRLLNSNQVECLKIICKQIMGFVEIREIIKNQRDLAEANKKAMQLLGEEKEKLEVITNNLGDVVWILEPKENRIVYVSQSYEKVWERSCELLYNKTRNLLDGVHPEDLDKVQGNLLIQQDFDLEDTYRILTPEGEEKWLLQRSFIVRSTTGEAYRVVGVTSDITAKRKIEEELRVKSEQLETIVNHIPLFLTLYNEDMSYDWVNRTFESKLGINAEDMKRPGAMDKILTPEERKKAFHHMNNHSGNEWMELESKDKNGETLKTSWMNVRLSSGQFIGIGQDITNQKKIEGLLKEQQVKMVNAAKLSSLGEMAAGVAHEINNPLTIIMGNTHILKHMAATNDINPKVVSEVSETIQNTIHRIAKIVSGLKNFARDGGNEPFQRTNLLDVIQETLAFCEARFKNNGVRLEVIQPQTEVILDCRNVQISQVILNLLNNAFDAVQTCLEKWVKLKISEDKDFVTIMVQDSGGGIPKDIQEKIMLPFFTTKVTGKGTGLGLSLSKGLVESHGGSLILDTKDQNTTFVIILPKKRTA